jgi:hypothetical protein
VLTLIALFSLVCVCLLGTMELLQPPHVRVHTPSPSPTASPLPGPVPESLAGTKYQRGVNSYTMEFNRYRSSPPGTWGEPQSSYDLLAAHGITIVRLAFSWDMVQPLPSGNPTAADVQAGLNGPLDPEGMAALNAEVHKIERAGMYPVLDLHNGCGYPNGPGSPPKYEVYCGAGISIAQVQHTWGMLAEAFKSDPMIAAYDLFNEPETKELSFATYKAYTQAAVSAIRRTGDRHRIWVESMLRDFSLADNATKGPWIRSHGKIDHSIVYSQHFYPLAASSNDLRYRGDDSYGSFLDGVTAFGEWCRRYAVHCSVGEVGWPSGSRIGNDPASVTGWNGLGDRFYAIADAYRLDVTYFAASSETSGFLIAYRDDTDTFPAHGITVADTQAEVIEAHPTR